MAGVLEWLTSNNRRCFSHDVKPANKSKEHVGSRLVWLSNLCGSCKQLLDISATEALERFLQTHPDFT